MHRGILKAGMALGLILAALFGSENVPAGVSILRCVLVFFSAAVLVHPFENQSLDDPQGEEDRTTTQQISTTGE